MLRRSLALALLLTFAACSSGNPIFPVNRVGLTVSESDASVAVSADRLLSALQSASGVRIAATVDHQQAAQQAGFTLAPNRVVLFGDPALGTPLMQINQQAGIDLPQRLSIYEDAEGATQVRYNTVNYLAARHGVGAAQTLSDMADALVAFSDAATGGSTIFPPTGQPVGENEGVVRVASQNDFETTWSRLRAAVADVPDLRTVVEIDHQANATSVGLTLRPTRLLVFGDPAVGTVFMQAEPTTGIDLPQKMLVWEEEGGQVILAYNDPGYIAQRHEFAGELPEVVALRTALAALANEAASSD